MQEDVAALAKELGETQFVSLVTYKRDGTPVGSAMWIASDGDDLVAWTPADAWKVKRVRRDPRIVVIRSSRMGKVDPVDPELLGTAVVEDSPMAVAKAEQLIRRKYGAQFHIITTIEAILARGRKPRVALRITPQQVNSKAV
ncbi:PPOX class F420-dependent oxidoreductase [Mycolicibacterium sp. BiH015]|uniref:PPOX class F420-dependent oxidoreductase n=1 Tax=Mycolicibacterium sp. BiH015 TaxID=3018808 RepID=UPI0022E168F9|nr:PPOX class F420-dependent oxidoreductase [Mycolicibacterium sp. BiH015]MDA2890288.1 PPOX class F420-dependent oxidoreductase [Mycolicibacterium sp. BiH015]